MIELFSNDTALVSHALHVQLHVDLIALSLLIAFVSSWAAFYIAHTSQQYSSVIHRRLSLLCASMAMGLGIWAMHFIGMMAMPLPQVIAYDLGLTALSILPGILSAWLALVLIQVRRPSYLRIACSGILIGLGIAAMHYCGIAAMQVQGSVRIHLGPFVLSAASGLVFATLALLVQRWLNQQPARGSKFSPLHTLPPTLLTIAIASMHYLSMYGLHLVPAAGHSQQTQQLVNSNALALLIAAVAMGVLLVMGLTTGILRYRNLWQAVAQRDARLKAMIDTAKDGVITIDARGLIQDYNPAAAQVFGYSHDEVIGRNVSMLMPSPLAEQHDNHIQRHLGHLNQPISVNGREVLGKCKDGRLIPLQLAIGKAVLPSGTIYVGYLQDISERKRMDAQLRIAASVFEHVREGLVSVDANYNVSDVNPAFVRLMGKGREACIGRPLEELYEDAETPPDMHKVWLEVRNNQYWQGEINFVRPNGSMWVQRLSITAVLNEQKRPHHYIAVASDVSDLSSLEVARPLAELHDSATGLPTQKLFMERMSNCLANARRKSMLLGIMVFEIRPEADSVDIEVTDLSSSLTLMAQLLQPHLRNTDTLSRTAPDQLTLLLPHIKNADAFEVVKQRITLSLQQAIHSHGKLSLSETYMGSSCYPVHGVNTNELLEHAKASLAAMSESIGNPLSL